MRLDDYVTLGRSGLRVSPLCLGTMTFGEDWGWGSTVEDTKRILDAYIDAGGNFIDTANIYTKGHSEKIIGDHVCADPRKRERAVIATKFFGGMRTGDPNCGGAGRKAMMNACEHSLRRLRTDYIDLYWMHCWDPHTPIDETMRALDDLVRAGKVRHIGFSDVPAWKAVQAQYEAIFRAWTPSVALQIEYSLLERTVEGDLTPMAREMGMGVTPWSPLRGGVLSGKYDRKSAAADAKRGEWVAKNFNEKTFDLVDLLKGIAAGKRIDGQSATAAHVALAWLRQKPGVTSIIIGATSLGQLSANIGSLALELTAEEMKRLDEATAPALPFPHEFVKRAMQNQQAGTSVNGQRFEPWGLAPKEGEGY